MSEIKISVIIPTLNVARYIPKTLQSLLAQTFKDFEVLFVDGGSTDGTLDIIESTIKEAPFEWKTLSTERKGVSVARNLGIKTSQGKYIYFLDGDDYISPQCLELAYERITSDNADIVFFGYGVVKGSTLSEDYISRFSYPSCPIKGIDAIKKILLREIMIWTHSALYKKQLIMSNNIKFPEGISRGEDFEFIMKALFHAGKVTCVKKTLAYYVLRENSLSHSYSIKDFEWIAARRRVYYYFKKHGAPKEILDFLWNVDIPNMLVGILRRVYIATMTNNLSKDKFIRIVSNPEIRSTLKRVSLHNSWTFSTYLLSKIFLYYRLLLPIYTQFLKIEGGIK